MEFRFLSVSAAHEQVERPLPILVVEDSEDDMEAVSRAFKKTGITNSIEHAWTAEEALEFLRSPKNPRPCLILLDLNMPGMGGRRALEIIKKDTAIMDVPVVVLTTSNYEADIETCYALGANTYIQKPLNFEDLCASIRNVTEYWLGTALLPPLRKERERATRLMKEKEAAEKASHIKSDFLASMSHELRTPLNSIIGMTRLLYEDASLGDEHRTMVGIVHRSAGGLLVIVNDILDLSKVEAGQIELESIPFSLEEVMHNVIDTMAPLCNDKGLKLVNNFALNGGLPYLTGDPTRLSRLMINLLGNAVKYTETGTVTVDVQLEKNTKAGENAYALIWSVTDTGIGIPEDRIDHIFDRFAQADESITRRYGGTGLGLTITRQIVEKMGGAIGVESAVGKGSRFWFRVPFVSANIEPGTRKKPNARQASLSRLPASMRKKAAEARLLVADDHPLNQAFMQKLLPRLGIGSFDSAETGKEVVEALAKKSYDVILLDCHMPVMSGYEAVEKIRADERAREAERAIPVIAMTADAMTGTRERCLASGMDDYISKPIDSDELKLVLSQWLTFEDDGADAGEEELEESLVDLTALRRFIVDEDELSELLISFSAQIDEAVETLRQNCVSGESKAWNAAASKIRNSGAIVKADELRQLAKRAEGMKDATAGERERIAKQISDAWTKVRHALEK